MTQLRQLPQTCLFSAAVLFCFCFVLLRFFCPAPPVFQLVVFAPSSTVDLAEQGPWNLSIRPKGRVFPNMPGPWLTWHLDADYVREVTLGKGDLVEVRVFDEKWHPQGSAIYSLIRAKPVGGHGRWLEADFITCSDPYFRWWSAHEGRRLPFTCARRWPRTVRR